MVINSIDVDYGSKVESDLNIASCKVAGVINQLRDVIARLQGGCKVAGVINQLRDVIASLQGG